MKKILAQIGEFGLIKLLKKKTKTSSAVLLGIGDDTAVLRESSHAQLLTTDVMVEHVDFSFKTATPKQVGWKALAINLSDIAAMGGNPKAAVIGLAVPQTTALKNIQSFYDGILEAGNKFGVSIVGGDLSRGPCWMISVAMLGEVGTSGAILRSGAKPNDLLCVTGELGGSILRKHLQFVPRVAEGGFLASERATSMIDISDGLLQDLGHLLNNSKTSADVWLDQIPVSRDARKLSSGNSKQALRHALTDGEDFELLFTISEKKFKEMQGNWKRKFKTRVTAIGKITRDAKGKVTFFERGRKTKLAFSIKGFNHFSSASSK